MIRLSRAVALLPALLLGACTQSPPPSPAPAPTPTESAPAPSPTKTAASDPGRVAVGQTGGTATTGRWTVTAAGTTKAAVLTAEPTTLPTTRNAAPPELTVGPNPVKITLQHAKLDGLGIIKLSRAEPVPPGTDATLAYFDTETKRWEPVPTKLARDRRTLTAQVDHFSIWDDLAATFGTLLSTRVDQPVCDGILPSWARKVRVIDDANTPLRWCSGTDPDHPGRLQVKVAVNRGYGFLVNSAVVPTSFDMPQIDSSVKDYLTWNLSPSLSSAVKQLISFRTSAIVPPGKLLTLTYDKTSLFNFPEDTALVRARSDVSFVLGGIIYAGLEKASDHQAALKALFAVLAVQDCIDQVRKVSDYARAAKAIYDCVDATDGALAAGLVAVVQSQFKVAHKTAVEAAESSLRQLKFVTALRTLGTAAAGFAEWRLDRKQPSSVFEAVPELDRATMSRYNDWRNVKDWILEPYGLGPVRLGDQPQSVEKLGLIRPHDGDCERNEGWEATSKLTAPGAQASRQQVEVTILGNQVTGISVRNAFFPTAKGAHVGMSVHQLRQMYSGQLGSEEKFAGKITVQTLLGDFPSGFLQPGLLFFLDQGKVTQITSGSLHTVC